MIVYGIELSFNNKEESFEAPVLPGAIEISDGGNGKTYDAAGLGEINVIKSPKLQEYSFSSLFPNQRYPFVTVDTLLSPVQYVQYLLRWMKTKRPIRFIFESDAYRINTPASIESFEWKEVAGSGGDIEYTLKLKRYVFYAAQRVVAVDAGTSGNADEPQLIQKEPVPRPNDRQPPQTYTLVPVDSLWRVAQLQFGNGSRWKEIQQLNDIADDQLERLPIGLVLRLPSSGGAANG